MLVFSLTTQCTLKGFGCSSRIKELTCNQVQDGDRDRDGVWTSPPLQLPYQWAEDEVVPEAQVPHQGDEEEVVFEHTSTEDWEQEIAIDVVALEGSSTSGEGNNIPDGNTDVELGLHQGSRHPSKAEQESEVSRPRTLARFSIKTCQKFFGIFSLWVFLALVLWTMM